MSPSRSAQSVDESWQQVRAHMKQGRYVTAHGSALRHGALENLDDPDLRALAARLVGHLGNRRLATAFTFYTYRRHSLRARLMHLYGMILLRRRGPLATLGFIRQDRDDLEGDAEHHAYIVSLEAVSLAMLRDFERARETMSRAYELAPDHPWLHTQSALIEEIADDLDAALSAVDRAIEVSPHHRAGLQMRADLLSRAGRVDEAIEVLTRATKAESYALDLQLADLLGNRGRWGETGEVLARARRHALLADVGTKTGIRAREAEAAYRLGDRRGAIEGYTALGAPWATDVAARLEAAEVVPDRVSLKVPYVRQRHLSCAPATLTSIAHFHQCEVDHDAVIEKVCFGGTPAHRERLWAEEEGFIAREFDLDDSTLRSLVARGLPFTLTTHTAATGHLQAVAGHDAIHQTALIRDPSTPTPIELRLPKLLETEAWTGPRAMTVVPKDQAHLLEGIELKNAEVWDLFHVLSTALERHDPATAKGALDSLFSTHPGHELTRRGEASFAYYEADFERSLAAVEALLERHPGVPRLLWLRANSLSRARARSESLPLLESLADSDDPGLLRLYARQALADPEHRHRVRRVLRRSVRIDSQAGEAYQLLSMLEATGGRLEEAFNLARYAVCLSEGNEEYAWSYFLLAIRLGRSDEALALLTRRVEDARARGGGPAETLFSAYAYLGRPDDGYEILSACAAARPDDGDLTLACASACLRRGIVNEAEEMLERAEGKAYAPRHQLVAVRVLEAKGDTRGALSALKAAVRERPSDVEAQRAYAAALYDQDGAEAVTSHLEPLVEAHPHDRDLGRLYCESERAAPERLAMALEHHLGRHPADLWARRERVLVELDLGRPAQALEAAADSLRWGPEDSTAIGIRGVARAANGDVAGARGDFRHAIELFPDNVHAIQRLSVTYTSREEHRSDAKWLLDILLSKGTGGPALQAFGDLTVGQDNDERIAAARTLRGRYEALPAAWALHVTALTDAGRRDEALELSVRACERFPSYPPVWWQQAGLASLCHETKKEEAARRRALALSPLDAGAVFALAECLRANEQTDEAKQLLSTYRTKLPRSGLLLAGSAGFLREEGKNTEALDTLLDGLRFLPPNSPHWNTALDWEWADGTKGKVSAVARDLVTAHPHSVSHRLTLATCLSGADARTEFESLRADHPLNSQAADMLAAQLAREGEIHEALALCPPADWRGPVPHTMRGRRADILATSGDVESAMTVMGEVLAEHPGYIWGIERQLQWARALGNSGEQVRIGELAVRAQPHVATHYLGLGEALAATGEKDRGIAALTQGLALEPGNTALLGAVLDIYLSIPQLDQAAELLDRVRDECRRSDWATLRARVMFRQGDVEGALELIRDVLREELPSVDLRLITQDFVGRGEGIRFSKLLAESFTGPEPASGELIGECWCTAMGRQTPKLGAALFGQLDELNEAGNHAVALIIEEKAVGGPFQRLDLRFRLWRLREQLRSSTKLWGSVGFALYSLGRFRACRSWLADWRERERVLPWMLLNMVLASWVGRDLPSASEANEAALKLPPDHTRNDLESWGALTRALLSNGDPTELFHPPQELRPHARSVMHFARALVIAERLDGDVGAREFMQAVDEEIRDGVNAGGGRPAPPIKAARSTALIKLIRRAPFFAEVQLSVRLIALWLGI